MAKNPFTFVINITPYMMITVCSSILFFNRWIDFCRKRQVVFLNFKISKNFKFQLDFLTIKKIIFNCKTLFKNRKKSLHFLYLMSDLNITCTMHEYTLKMLKLDIMSTFAFTHASFFPCWVQNWKTKIILRNGSKSFFLLPWNEKLLKGN